MRNVLYKSTALSVLALAGIAFIGMAQPAAAQILGGASCQNPLPGLQPGNFPNYYGVTIWPSSSGGGTSSGEIDIIATVTMPVGGPYNQLIDQLPWTGNGQCENAVSAAVLCGEQATNALNAQAYHNVNDEVGLSGFASYCPPPSNPTGGGNSACGDINFFVNGQCMTPTSPYGERVTQACGTAVVIHDYEECCQMHLGAPGCPSGIE